MILPTDYAKIGITDLLLSSLRWWCNIYKTFTLPWVIGNWSQYSESNNPLFNNNDKTNNIDYEWRILLEYIFLILLYELYIKFLYD